jgi:hypothetical protein
MTAPPTDAELVAAAATVARAVALLRAVTAAKLRAVRRFAPRQPARLSHAQLAETYRRSNVRDPRNRWSRWAANDDRSAA